MIDNDQNYYLLLVNVMLHNFRIQESIFPLLQQLFPNILSDTGFAIGLYSLASSLTAGIRGSVMDRWGQKWTLRILVPASTPS